MKRAHSLQEIVDAGWAPSVRWLREAIRRGDVPGVKVARSGRGGSPVWKMSDDDVEQFIESRRNGLPKAQPTVTSLNLTPAALRRRRAG